MIRIFLISILLYSCFSFAKTPRALSNEYLAKTPQELITMNKEVNQSFASINGTWANEYTYIHKVFMIKLDMFYVSRIDSEAIKKAGFNLDDEMDAMKSASIDNACANTYLRALLIAGGKISYQYSKLNHGALPGQVITFEDCRYL